MMASTYDSEITHQRIREAFSLCVPRYDVWNSLATHNLRRFNTWTLHSRSYRLPFLTQYQLILPMKYQAERRKYKFGNNKAKNGTGRNGKVLRCYDCKADRNLAEEKGSCQVWYFRWHTPSVAQRTNQFGNSSALGFVLRQPYGIHVSEWRGRRNGRGTSWCWLYDTERR